MDFPAPERSGRSRRQRWLAVLATLAATISTLMAGAAHAAAAGNGANAWGSDGFGRLGNGLVQASNSFPGPVSGLSEVTAVSAGNNFGLGISNGTVTSWGEGEAGQMGNGRLLSSGVPVTVCAVGATAPCAAEKGTEKGNALTEVQAISAGGGQALALLKSGKVVAWGENTFGQLGIGSTEKNSDVPVEVKGLPETEKFKAIAVAAGGEHSMALMENEKKETKVMAWGENEFGQLGIGTTSGPEKCGEQEAEVNCSRSPVEVTGLNGLTETAISAGFQFSMALTSTGTVKDWGSEAAGELGNGVERTCKELSCLTEKPSSPSPTEPKFEAKESTEIEQIAAGGLDAMVKLKSGGLKAWGSGEMGELGTGTETSHDTPVAVTGLTEKAIASIASGYDHNLALLNNTEKTVMAWGNNPNGALGDGTTEGPEKCGEPKVACSKTPIAVGNGLAEVAGVSAGTEFSLSFGAPAPVVTSVTPKTGPEAGGTAVTITGTNFTGATAVKFCANTATEKEVNTEGTSIKTKSTAGTGTCDVTVTTPALTSRTSQKDQFKYRPAGLNATKWRSNGVALGLTPTPVFGMGAITLENSWDNNLIGKVTCHSLFGGDLWNEAEAGFGSIEGFGSSRFTCTKQPVACSGVYLTAETKVHSAEVQEGTEKRLVARRGAPTLPWPTEMNEVETEKVKSLADKISNIGLTLVLPCEPLPSEFEFSGTLEPRVVNGIKNGLSPSHLRFEGKGSNTGHLTGNMTALLRTEKETFVSGETALIGLGGNNTLIQGQ